MERKRILCLAPHPDDIEFSCGASVHRWLQEGHEVWYVAFSPCNKSLPSGYPVNAIYEELKQSTKVLGVSEDHLITYQFPVREFPHYRQEILEELIQLKRSIQPDWVCLPNQFDIHQDHHQIHLEGVRAFKHSCLLGYELPWNNFEFKSNFHVRISEENLQAKIKAVQQFSSQKGRIYSRDSFIRGQAEVKGVQVNSAFAEAYQLIHWVQ